MSEILSHYSPHCAKCRDAVGRPRAGVPDEDLCLFHLRLALAEAQHEAETLKTERNAALTLAEQRGAAYDMTWREVESLRERLDKEQEERGRQYGLRLQIADEFAFLRELLVAVVRTGTKDPLLDARIAEELRGHE